MKFVELMLKAALVYSAELEDGKAEAFFSVLSGFPVDEVEKGFNAHFKSSRFFPTPFDIIEKIKADWYEKNAFSSDEFPWR